MENNKFYPISVWKNNAEAVRFAFAHDSFDEAMKAGILAQNKYKDQIFLSVAECSGPNDGYLAAEKYVNALSRLKNK
jgi:hypothetical protein